MAQYKFNRIGTERKQLVGAISEILDQPTQYLGAPTFAYEVGEYHIDKEGTVTGGFHLTLFAALEERGFEYESSKTFHLITPRGTLLCQKRFDTAQEAEAEGYGIYFTHEGRDVYIKTNPDGETKHSKLFAVVGEPFANTDPTPEPEQSAAESADTEVSPEPTIDEIVIEMPLDGFTPENLDNLTKMVTAKEILIKKALGAEELPIRILDDRIAFPWFRLHEDNGEIHAYSQFITALCATAKEKKRVTAKAQDTFENEAFAMRVWLIGLGLVGKEFAACRKLMGRGLSGNSAWRYGKPEKEPEALVEPIPAAEEATVEEESGNDE